LDFRIAFSSLASVLGGLGFCAYAAASAVVDRVAESSWARDPRRQWTSICWDGWRFDGDESLRRLGGRHAVSPAEGQAALSWMRDRLDRLPRCVLVSTAPLDARFARAVDRPRAAEASSARPIGERRPAADASAEDLTIRIAGMWQELIGAAHVG